MTLPTSFYADLYDTLNKHCKARTIKEISTKLLNYLDKAWLITPEKLQNKANFWTYDDMLESLRCYSDFQKKLIDLSLKINQYVLDIGLAIEVSRAVEKEEQRVKENQRENRKKKKEEKNGKKNSDSGDARDGKEQVVPTSGELPTFNGNP